MIPMSFYKQCFAPLLMVPPSHEGGPAAPRSMFLDRLMIILSAKFHSVPYGREDYN